MKICDTPQRNLCMLIYMYLNEAECWFTSSMSLHRFKLKLKNSLNFAVIADKVIYEELF